MRRSQQPSKATRHKKNSKFKEANFANGQKVAKKRKKYLEFSL